MAGAENAETVQNRPFQAHGFDYIRLEAIADDGCESELTAGQAKSDYTLIAIEKDKELGEGRTVWAAPRESNQCG